MVQDKDQCRAVVNTVMNLPVPQNAAKFQSSCTTGGFSRKAYLCGVNYLCSSRLIMCFVAGWLGINSKQQCNE
jgi:hypothetical protein